MLQSAFLPAVFAGIDNLLVCLGIGLVPLDHRQRHRYALAFSAAEIIAALLGLAVGSRICATLARFAPVYFAAILSLCAASVLTLANMKTDLSRYLGSPYMIVCLPLMFSVDNFLTGATLSNVSSGQLRAVLMVGATGAVMSCAGLFLAAWVRTLFPRRLEFVAGGYLLLLAICAWMKE
jgi:putative Mn2+ efflux pump MntP